MDNRLVFVHIFIIFVNVKNSGTTIISSQQEGKSLNFFYSEQFIIHQFFTTYHTDISQFPSNTSSCMQLNSSYDVLSRGWAGSISKLERGIRERSKFNIAVDNFGLWIFTSCANGNVQWIEVIWPGMSLSCMWSLLIPMVYILISTKEIEKLSQPILKEPNPTTCNACYFYNVLDSCS